MRIPKPSDVVTEGGVAAPSQFASDQFAADPFPSGEMLTLPHQVEHEVQRQLLSQPALRFSSLVVRRIDNGVCLQGVLEVDDESPDVCTIAQRVAGVQQVLNRLVVAPPRRAMPVREVPAKG